VGNRLENEFHQGLVVAKFGTDTMVQDGRVNHALTEEIANQVWLLREAGTGTILVSSGERALGGQEPLTTAWRRSLAPHGLVVREILFRDDSIDQGLAAVKNAIAEGTVPLLNGQLGGRLTGNNDVLTGIVARELDASAAFLTKAGGVWDHERRVMPFLTGNERIVFHGKSVNGTGTMNEKTFAAASVDEIGQQAIIAHPWEPSVLVRFKAGQTGFGTRIR